MEQQMPAILQPAPIDISSWREDEEFFRYPEGARVKRAVFPVGDDNQFLRPERRHLFKKSRRAFPDQYWAEVVAYHVGSNLGVDGGSRETGNGGNGEPCLHRDPAGKSTIGADGETNGSRRNRTKYAGVG